jgi:hypothetical protein
MAIHISRLSARDEMFTFSPNDGDPKHFATTRLVAYLKSSGAQVCAVDLDEALVAHVARKHGIEPGHLTKTLDRVEEPCVFLDYGDGTHIVADGNHRVVARHLLGMKTVPAWLVPKKVWQRFLIEGVPSNPKEAAAFSRRYPQF